jgi:hypothetical protein
MTASKGKVIYLHQRNPQEALERLNRITGLQFSSWPQSLRCDPPAEPLAAADGLSSKVQDAGEVLSG